MIEGFPEENPIVIRLHDGSWFCRICDKEIPVGEWSRRHAGEHQK